jgi:hypothetical protein
MTRVLILAATLILAACSPGKLPSVEPGRDPAQFGIACLPVLAEKGTLFGSYRPSGSSRWSNNWTSPLDLTGVSWNDPRTATLVSPSHVVMAAHFSRSPAVPLVFHDRQGIAHTRSITSVIALRGVGDISVAKLNMPLPPQVKPYRLADPSQATIGRSVIVTDQTRTLSIHRIAAIHGRKIQFEFIPGLHPVYRRKLIYGDSGNPSFLLGKNGELTLLETHTNGGPGTGPFYGHPEVQSAIRAAISELGN